MHKHRIAALLAALAALSLFGCGARQPRPTVPMADLRERMLAAAPSLPEMKTVSDGDEGAQELFAYCSDLPYGKVERFFLSYSAAGQADEIAVIAVKDSADAGAAVQSLRRHLSERIRIYRQYQPDQAGRAEAALVFAQGRYAVLILCDDADSVKKAFSDAVRAG